MIWSGRAWLSQSRHARKPICDKHTHHLLTMAFFKSTNDAYTCWEGNPASVARRAVRRARPASTTSKSKSRRNMMIKQTSSNTAWNFKAKSLVDLLVIARSTGCTGFRVVRYHAPVHLVIPGGARKDWAGECCWPACGETHTNKDYYCSECSCLNAIQTVNPSNKHVWTQVGIKQFFTCNCLSVIHTWRVASLIKLKASVDLCRQSVAKDRYSTCHFDRTPWLWFMRPILFFTES